ncbi:hypothetical protein DR864_29390 (plasmid) [Runella rosea]|uniref:DUF1565 domain-containing protein n=1 Tax=Runella rosea TaxID=2259595 RepID=A0A344TTL0_9BACT|nr:3-coathanger stack domain-containing protein [Runella rosea]AXE21981.1 hypothetical protein DR864_29390 [Runella rosea]
MKYLFLAIIILSCYGNCYAEIYYVKTNGNDTINDGKSWNAAFATLQKALQVSQYGDQIWVTQGTYKPTAYPSGITNQSSPLTDRDKAFEMVNGVKLYGGFSGDETSVMQRIADHRTILSGDIGVENNDIDNCYHVLISINDDSTTLIDGFTITQGRAKPNPPSGPNYIIIEGMPVYRTAGGAMFFRNTFAKLNNILFTGNMADIEGGGMCSYGSSPLLTNVVFSENRGGMGGGMANKSRSNPSLLNVNFSANIATPDGGGMYNEYSSPILENVLFISNSAPLGGGMKNYQSYCQLTNVVFHKNIGSFMGGGMHNAFYSAPTLKNAVFWKNSSPAGGGLADDSKSASNSINVTFAENTSRFSSVVLHGGGAVFVDDSKTKIKNSIFWGNKYLYNNTLLDNDIITRKNSEVSVSNSLLQLPNTATNYPSASFLALDSAHNIFAQNPLFVDVVNGNLRLEDCSPAVNAGDTVGVPATDLDGNIRPYPAGSTDVDMGAYENQTIAWPAHLNITEPITNGAIVKVAGEITATNQISGAIAVYQGTKSVTLLPDFSATSNTFTAVIGGCGTGISASADGASKR